MVSHGGHTERVARHAWIAGGARKPAFFAALSAVCIGLGGCSTATVQIQARRLPKHEIAGIQRVAIMDLDEGDARGFSGSAFSALLTDAIISQGHYTVVERDRRDEVLAEQGFQQSAVADERAAVEAGQMLGAEGLIFGRLDSAAVETARSWRDQVVAAPDGTMRRERVPTMTKKATLSVTLRMVNVQTGQLVASANKTYSQKAPIFGTAVGMAAISRLPSDQELLKSPARKVVQYFVPLISPTYHPAERQVMKGDTEAARKSFTLIRSGAWRPARRILAKAAEQGSEDPAVYNNLGVCSEQAKQFADAEAAYDEAIELAPGDDSIRENYKGFTQGSKYVEPKEDSFFVSFMDALVGSMQSSSQ